MFFPSVCQDCSGVPPKRMDAYPLLKSGDELWIYLFWHSDFFKTRNNNLDNQLTPGKYVLKNSLAVYTPEKALTTRLTDKNAQGAFRGSGKNWVSLKSNGDTVDEFPKAQPDLPF